MRAQPTGRRRHGGVGGDTAVHAAHPTHFVENHLQSAVEPHRGNPAGFPPPSSVTVGEVQMCARGGRCSLR